MQRRPKKLQERVFEKIFEIAEIEQFTREEREAYEDSLKHYRDLKNSMDTAKAEGEKIGIEKGKKEGEKIGIEKGKKETAEKLISSGVLPPEQIADATGKRSKPLKRRLYDYNFCDSA